jgi:hypothetical protein
MFPQKTEEGPMPLPMLGEEGTDQQFQQKEKQQAGSGGYRSGEVRCYNCAHFTDPDKCAKGVNGGKVDPEGSSDQFQPISDDEGMGEESTEVTEGTEAE